MVSYMTDEARLNGVFSLSRAFGDIDHKRLDLPPEERAMSGRIIAIDKYILVSFVQTLLLTYDMMPKESTFGCNIFKQTNLNICDG